MISALRQSFLYVLGHGRKPTCGCRLIYASGFCKHTRRSTPEQRMEKKKVILMGNRLCNIYEVMEECETYIFQSLFSSLLADHSYKKLSQIKSARDRLESILHLPPYKTIRRAATFYCHPAKCRNVVLVDIHVRYNPPHAAAITVATEALFFFISVQFPSAYIYISIYTRLQKNADMSHCFRSAKLLQHFRPPHSSLFLGRLPLPLCRTDNAIIRGIMLYRYTLYYDHRILLIDAV